MQKVTEGAGTLATAYEQAADTMKNDINVTEEFTGTVKAVTGSAKSLASSYENLLRYYLNLYQHLTLQLLKVKLIMHNFTKLQKIFQR